MKDWMPFRHCLGCSLELCQWPYCCKSKKTPNLYLSEEQWLKGWLLSAIYHGHFSQNAYVLSSLLLLPQLIYTGITSVLYLEVCSTQLGEWWPAHRHTHTHTCMYTNSVTIWSPNGPHLKDLALLVNLCNGEITWIFSETFNCECPDLGPLCIERVALLRTVHAYNAKHNDGDDCRVQPWWNDHELFVKYFFNRMWHSL